MKRRIARATCAFVISLTAFPAAVALAQIPKSEKTPYAAPSDQALLVFSRPRQRQASEVTFRVVTHAGRCLAQLENDTQMAAALWPGTHMLMIITGSAPPTVQLLHAKVSAGKTYVVELKPRVNVKYPVKMSVMRRSEQPLEAFPSAIRDTIAAKRDLRKCTEWVSWKRPKIEPRAERAKYKWDEEASDELRAAHSLRRNDGWTAAEIYEP
jgi:hypothetical protein